MIPEHEAGLGAQHETGLDDQRRDGLDAGHGGSPDAGRGGGLDAGRGGSPDAGDGGGPHGQHGGGVVRQAEVGPALSRRLLGWEIVVVFAVSLGASALFAIINLIGSLTAHQALGKQQALLVGSLAPGRPLLDLTLQLASLLTTLAPVALVFYLMARDGEGPSAMGLDGAHPAQDALRGALLAAVIGGTGLGLYLAAFHLGFSLNVVPESLPPVWWRIPVLILKGAQNGILEEILVVGYLLRRLGQLGWSAPKAIAASALLRGSYHLYQGFGGFAGNAAMGVIFGVLYRRWGRVTPLVIAHSLIDAVAFTGYAALHGRVSWLP